MDKDNQYPQLVTMICDALEHIGYGVLESIELWNTQYKPMIKAMPDGKHTIEIGSTVITFTIKKFDKEK